MIKSISQLLVLLLISFSAWAQHPAETVPDFKFFTFKNTTFTAKDLICCKPLFLIYFDASCEHCQRAVTKLNDEYPKLKDVSIYLISSDPRLEVVHFMKKYGTSLYTKKNVTLLLDPKNEFISKFGPRKYPSMFLYSERKTLLDYEDNEESMFRILNQVERPPQALKKTMM